MKKVFIAALVMAFGVSQQVQAQDVEFGVKAGLNMSNLTGGDADRDSHLDFHIGVISEIQFSDKFALQPELLYSRQGAEVTEGDKVEFNLDYIALPIMAKYYLADGFSVQAGPQFSFLVDDKAEFEDDAMPDVDTDASNFDFGANIGLGYDFDFGLFAQARYNAGLTYVGENPDLRTSVFQVSLGYKF